MVLSLLHIQEIHYTPIQQRILKVLSDGMRHHWTEIRDAVGDEYINKRNINNYMFLLRKKLRLLDQEIVCEIVGFALHYRHVILLKGYPKDGTGETLS